MSETAAALAFAVDLFSDMGRLAARRMFGGAGLYAGGVMFGLVDDDVIYLKVDETLRTDLAAAGARSWIYTERKGPKAGIPGNFILVPAGIGAGRSGRGLRLGSPFARRRAGDQSRQARSEQAAQARGDARLGRRCRRLRCLQADATKVGSCGHWRVGSAKLVRRGRNGQGS
jgi:hypothetical protein